jgi:transketolase
MGAIVNGLAVHGGIIKPYSATFFTFSDYMRPAVRIGCLMGINPIYVFTHDSIGLGEDGPTHQPVEHLIAMRAIPDLYVIRPADANETAAAWHVAMQLDKPTALIFTRQDVPILTGEDVGGQEAIRGGVARGGYVLADCEGTPQVILIATGSEVHIAYEAYKTLTAEGVKARLVSLPCWKLFDRQDSYYHEAVLPASVTARVSIEAGVTLGWERYVGQKGIALGINRFGASAPYQRIYQEYGLTTEKVVETARKLM